ncbi:SGNH/GDSL hydrolase family protein [Caulobacter sp. KR2-114]|uniref:SGNH/GDSL hydrolase family protein n=1 Tax=Caulobacter sp. KR2-114 TaxID=3400912 RepID=UPI003C0247C9
MAPTLGAVAAAACVLWSTSTLARETAQSPDQSWSVTWLASAEPPRSPPTVLTDETVREVARVSLGGGRFRVRLTNAYGAKPAVVGSAHLARATAGASIVAGSDRSLTFGGRPGVTIPPYASVLSDPVDLPVPNLSDVAISLYFPGASGDATSHFFGLQDAYVAHGDVTGQTDLQPTRTLTERPFVSAIEVSTAKRAKVVLAFGDSITDGFGSTPNANRRWPDRLAERLVPRRGPTYFTVVDAAISGNRLLHDFIGPNGLSRFDRDVLSQPRVDYVVVLEGINDLGFPGARNLTEETVSADDVIFAYKQLIARAHAHDIKVIGATLPPFGPIPERPGFYSEASAQKRDAINAWIRTSHAFDAVIDFDAVLRDPARPTQLLAAYDSGDHLNPNDAGYQAMADAIDLKLFDR